MARHIGQVLVESVAAETPKFTAPLLLVHGLWCTASVWKPFMGYFAHRGWACVAIHLRGRAGTSPLESREPGAIGFADHLNDLRDVVAACTAPPVLIGHDVGALLSLCLETTVVRAVVAITPLLSPPDLPGRQPAISSWRSRLAMRLQRPVPPPHRKLAADYFGGRPPGGAVSESPRLVDDLRGRQWHPVAGPLPRLLLAGTADRFCPPSAAAAIASRLPATLEVIPNAMHPMPWASGWEHRVAQIHRWLIQSLGEPLLAFNEDDDV